MHVSSTDFSQLLDEYTTLVRHSGDVQKRCDQVICQQRAQIELQQKQIMQLRAKVMTRDSTLAFLQADMTNLSVESPGPQRQALEASLVAADLVICQTGCLSHGEYWRVQDHCKRTGKTCVLVEQPDAVRIVRINKAVPDTVA